MLSPFFYMQDILTELCAHNRIAPSIRISQTMLIPG